MTSSHITVKTMIGQIRVFPIDSYENITQNIKKWLDIRDVRLFTKGNENALTSADILTPLTIYYAIPCNPEFDQLLLNACWDGNVIESGILINNHGADVNVSGTNDYRPIHYAAQYSLLSSVQLLIHHSADVNVVTDNGYTPLHFASLYGLETILTLLLQNGADVTGCNSIIGTPLQLAMQRNNTKCIQILQTYGAV